MSSKKKPVPILSPKERSDLSWKMYLQAQGAFCSAEILNEHIDNKDVGRVGMYPKDPSRVQYLLGPHMFTLYAFSLELYFKLIIVKENGIQRDTHDLYQLYSELPEHIRFAIDFYYKNPPSHFAREVFDGRAKLAEIGAPDTLDGIIKMGRHAFRDSRYYYEEGKSIFLLLPEVIFATRQYIYDNNPKWPRTLHIGDDPVSSPFSGNA